MCDPSSPPPASPHLSGSDGLAKLVTTEITRHEPDYRMASTAHPNETGFAWALRQSNLSLLRRPFSLMDLTEALHACSSRCVLAPDPIHAPSTSSSRSSTSIEPSWYPGVGFGSTLIPLVPPLACPMPQPGSQFLTPRIVFPWPDSATASFGAPDAPMPLNAGFGFEGHGKLPLGLPFFPVLPMLAMAGAPPVGTKAKARGRDSPGDDSGLLNAPSASSEEEDGAVLDQSGEIRSTSMPLS